MYQSDGSVATFDLRLGLDVDDGRKNESESFSGSGLPDPDKVDPGESDGPTLRLDPETKRKINLTKLKNQCQEITLNKPVSEFIGVKATCFNLD